MSDWSAEKVDVTRELCPFGSGLGKFALDYVVVISLDFLKKSTSGRLILSLEKIDLL